LPFLEWVADKEEPKSAVADLDRLDLRDDTGVKDDIVGTLDNDRHAEEADVPRTELASDISLFCRVVARWLLLFG
jgi:hypothetical protein